MTIIPISISRVNWDGLNVLIKNKLGTTLSKPLDLENISLNRLLSFPMVMGIDKKIDPRIIHRQPYRLKHIYMSLGVITGKSIIHLVQLHTELRTMSMGPLTNDHGAVDTDWLYMISGSLYDWVDAYHNLVKDVSVTMTELAKKIKQFLVVDLEAPQLFS